MITIEKLKNGNYLIEGERDEMNSFKYQVYMHCIKMEEMYEWEEELINILKSHNTFEQIELQEEYILPLYKFIEYLNKYSNTFKKNNDMLKEVLIKNIMVKRYLAIEKLKNIIKER